MTKLRIGYAKFGRSMTLNSDQFGFQGDAEAPQLLERLAKRNPNVAWVLVGRNRGTINLPNVENPWINSPKRPSPGDSKFVPIDDFELNIIETIGKLDGCVVHMGQHGTSHISIPMVPDTWHATHSNQKRLTTPLLWAQAYGRYLMAGLNAMGDRTDGHAPISWLCTDPRNYMKARDLKWPTGLNDVLAQYMYTRNQKHDRFEDPRLPREFGIDWCTTERNHELWSATHSYRYADLELMILPDNWYEFGQASFNDRKPIGVASTSFANGVGKDPRRSELIRDLILKSFPNAEIYGKWDTTSLQDVPAETVRQNKPHEFFDILNRWRVSITLPALGSSWTVAKPYQLFASRVVSFMYGRLDDQGWVLPSRRHVKPAKLVDDSSGYNLYSVRDDWTSDELALARWLRVETADEYESRARIASTVESTWEWLTNVQLNLLKRRRAENYLESEIERQLGITANV